MTTTEASTQTASLTLPAPVLRDLLAGAVVCAARDMTTPALECVRLTWDGADVKADSTDRYRIVEGTYGAAKSTGPASILLDRRESTPSSFAERGRSSLSPSTSALR